MFSLILFFSVFAATSSTFIKSDGKTIAYKTSNISLAWIDAFSYCKRLGGQLAVIPSEHDQRLVEFYLETADPDGGKYFWIGLTDMLSEGIFKWMPDFVTATYLNWNPHQYNYTSEDFVLVMRAVDERKWGDCHNYCGSFTHALCEFEI